MKKIRYLFSIILVLGAGFLFLRQCKFALSRGTETRPEPLSDLESQEDSLTPEVRDMGRDDVDSSKSSFQSIAKKFAVQTQAAMPIETKAPDRVSEQQVVSESPSPSTPTSEPQLATSPKYYPPDEQDLMFVSTGYVKWESPKFTGTMAISRHRCMDPNAMGPCLSFQTQAPNFWEVDNANYPENIKILGADSRSVFYDDSRHPHVPRIEAHFLRPEQYRDLDIPNGKRVVIGETFLTKRNRWGEVIGENHGRFVLIETKVHFSKAIHDGPWPSKKDFNRLFKVFYPSAGDK